MLKSLFGFVAFWVVCILLMMVLIHFTIWTRVVQHLRNRPRQHATWRVMKSELPRLLDEYRKEHGFFPADLDDDWFKGRCRYWYQNSNCPEFDSQLGILDAWGTPFRFELHTDQASYSIALLGRDQRTGGRGLDADMSMGLNELPPEPPTFDQFRATNPDKEFGFRFDIAIVYIGMVFVAIALTVVRWLISVPDKLALFIPGWFPAVDPFDIRPHWIFNVLLCLTQFATVTTVSIIFCFALAALCL